MKLKTCRRIHKKQRISARKYKESRKSLRKRKSSRTMGIGHEEVPYRKLLMTNKQMKRCPTHIDYHTDYGYCH